MFIENNGIKSKSRRKKGFDEVKNVIVILFSNRQQVLWHKKRARRNNNNKHRPKKNAMAFEWLPTHFDNQKNQPGERDGEKNIYQAVTLSSIVLDMVYSISQDCVARRSFANHSSYFFEFLFTFFFASINVHQENTT